MTTSIIEYSETEAALSSLAQKYSGVLFAVGEHIGMADAKKSRAELRGYRIALEKKRVEIKAPALKRAQEIDSEARRITAELLALEEPIDAQIKAEEARKEAERTAKARAEIERIEAEQHALREAEEARMAVQRAEIERQQAALVEAQRIAREKIDAEMKAARDLIEAAQRAARLAQEEQDRAARMAREEADRAARKAREEEQVRLQAEQATIDKAARELRAAQEAQEEARRQKEREEEYEAARIEMERVKAERLIASGFDSLRLFVQRFGDCAEFSEISAKIVEFLNNHTE